MQITNFSVPPSLVKEIFGSFKNPKAKITNFLNMPDPSFKKIGDGHWNLTFHPSAMSRKVDVSVWDEAAEAEPVVSLAPVLAKRSFQMPQFGELKGRALVLGGLFLVMSGTALAGQLAGWPWQTILALCLCAPFSFATATRHRRFNWAKRTAASSVAIILFLAAANVAQWKWVDQAWAGINLAKPAKRLGQASKNIKVPEIAKNAANAAVDAAQTVANDQTYLKQPEFKALSKKKRVTLADTYVHAGSGLKARGSAYKPASYAVAQKKCESLKGRLPSYKEMDGFTSGILNMGRYSNSGKAEWTRDFYCGAPGCDDVRLYHAEQPAKAFAEFEKLAEKTEDEDIGGLAASYGYERKKGQDADDFRDAMILAEENRALEQTHPKAGLSGNSAWLDTNDEDAKEKAYQMAYRCVIDPQKG